MRTAGKWLTLIIVLLGAVAFAQDVDPRGWSSGGTIAAGAGRVLGPMPDDSVIELPDAFAKTLKKPTLIVYFSPTCPHCKAVAPELQGLAGRLGKTGEVLWVATGPSTEDQMAEFKKEFAITSRMVIDTERAIGAAMGARSTPTALLVNRDKKTGVIAVEGAWYPYMPGHDLLVEMRVGDDPWAAFTENEYQGNNACAPCHTQEMDSWLLSFHAVAWGTLAKREEHENPECTGCHVTGNGQPTGWNGDVHSPLVDVGCESCHGPGGPHDGIRTEPREQCAGCHDDKHSIAFSYEKGLPLIDHFSSASMDSDEWMERRRAIFNGEVERELLAFGDGKRVGSASCAECHESQHASWQDSAHGKAMATLSEEAQADVSCVRCHATQNEFGGLPPTDLSGYGADEGGVGCESCHGPGEAHVAAKGGTDNIQGLGESCPVCVLEAICTSCHTAEWDKEWDLDTRLEGVKHAP